MRPTIAQVDAAVRAVLAQRRPSAPADRPFVGKLLGLRHVEALPAETRDVAIAPGTVVTPLARDLLKRRGIATRLVSEHELGRSQGRGEWGFVIEDDSGLASALRRGLLGDDDWAEVGSDALEAARWVSGG